MADRVPIRRALLSVSNKTDLVAFARSLVDLGVEIISTGGTAQALADAGISVIPVHEVTGFPEMMDGRVKTLHPAIHGGLLARRDLDEHLAAMQQHNITAIDLVCINLYPFQQTIQQPNVSTEQAIEMIDIGGPAMLRSAAKNHDFITVVTAPSQYDRVVSELRQHEGGTTFALRQELAAAAFTRTAEYDTAISAWMSATRTETFPTLLRLTYAHRADLRYGENPHQKAAVYSDPASGDTSIINADQRSGKQLSYNNINDAAAALELVRDVDQVFPGSVAAAVIKHTNACGCAIADTVTDAFEQAVAGDPLAAFGGILAVNTPVDAAAADAMTTGKKFLEVIIAPSFDAAAEQQLASRWPNVRLLATGSLRLGPGRQIDYRSVPGGLLAQQRDTALPQPQQWTHAAGPEPTPEGIETAALTWIVCKHLKSNAIAIGGGHRLLGVGTGQVDRVTACRLAVEKAREALEAVDYPVAASDAFFPFDDGPRVLIEAGVRCIVHPGGSKRDEDTIKLCNREGVTCLLTGMRHFLH